MKVNELKAELQARGLDTKGVKAQLIERLKEAMEKESGGGGAEVSTPTVAASKKLDVGTPNVSTPVRRSRRRSMTRSPSPVKTEVTPLDSVSEEPEHASEQADSAESSVRKKRRTRSITKSPSPVKPSAEKRLDVLEEEEAENTASPASSPQKPAATKPESPAKAAPVTPTKPATPVVASPAQAKTVTTPASAKKQPSSSPQATPEKPAAAPPATEPEPEKMVTEEVAKPAEPTQDAPASAATEEADVANASATDSLAEGDNDDNGNGEEEASAAEGQSADTSVDKGKSDAENKDSNNKPKKVQIPIEFGSDEVEPDIEEGKFALSWFDSHLNLEINPKTLDTARPISDGALAMVWAGARANLGVRQGKVAYEVLLTQTNNMHKVTDEAVTAEFRAGWSTGDADLQLGESKHSFAYGSDGHKGTECTFTEYGAQYKVNDVIGVYLDLESSPCKVEYTLNGTSQGVAFEFDSADLNGQALFPHVYSKNIAFKVNFGQLERSLLNDRKPEKAKEQPKAENKEAKDDDKKEATETTGEETKVEKASDAAATEQKSEEVEKKEEETKAPETEVKPEPEEPKEVEPKVINPEYVYVAETAKENLTTGATRPENRSECEVIFMIGMPGCGKTHWVKNYLSENPDKKYTVLSVDSLLNQMKLSGKPRLPSNTNKWSKLVDTLAKNLNKLNDIAVKRRRNFILDQTNTFASEQKRRLRGFGGYAARRAIVVVPDDEEYNRRLKQKQETYGVEVLEGQMNAMKAHFFLPTLELGWYTEIKYVELEEEKAREVVQKLNEVGRKLVPRGGYNRNQQFQQQNRRGAGNNQQRWNQGYGNNRFGGGQQYQQGGGYNAPNRYNNNAQQYSQNRNYRPGNGYGRQGGGYGGGARYGNNDWTRNNTGSYDNRFNNRGYQNSRARGYDRNRGYNSNWNQQNSNCWGYGSQNNDTQQWYSWWQSNLKNLLQQQGGNGSDNAQQSNMQQYWSQYAQQHNYGNYQQSKSHGSGGSSKNK